MATKCYTWFDVNDDDLRRMYSKELMQTQEIAKRYGVTRQTVWNHVKRLGLKTAKRKSRTIVCPYCKEPFRTFTWSGRQKYCSMRCYQSSVSVNGKYSRQGQRMAREVSGAEGKEIPHHIDGDNFNNNPWNLVVFPSNAAHISFHKLGLAALLKEWAEKTHWCEGGPFRWDWAYRMLKKRLPEAREIT